MHKPSNTLQQVKEWLEKCSRFPFETMKKWDALYYIQQLESRLSQVEQERAAAVKIIEDATTYLEDFGSVKFALMQLKKWRGVCEENTHDQP